MTNTLLQRFRHSGNPGDYGDWVVLLMSLPDASEQSCAAVVQALVDASRDQLAMRRPDHSKDNFSLHYTLWLSVDGKPENAWHESEFWPMAVKFPNLHEQIAQYVKQVNNTDYATSFQDEFHASGGFAIAELCLADKKWCGLLGKLLLLWDMEHETFQLELIDELVERYGSCDEILQLLAYRISADGQHSDEQIAAALFGHGLIKQIDLAQFASYCARIENRSVCSEIGLNHFAQTFANGKKSAYSQCWRAFHAAGIEAEPEAWDKAESLRRAASQVSRGASWNHDFTDATTSVLTPSLLHRLPDLTNAAAADLTHWHDLESDDRAPARPAGAVASLSAQAQKLAERGNPAGAIKLLAQLKKPLELADCLLLARCQIEREKPELALIELDAALQTDTTAELLATRAHLYLKLASQPPHKMAMHKAVRFLSSPAGQQHSEFYRQKAILDLQNAIALAPQQALSWRLDIIEANLDGERYDDALAQLKTLDETSNVAPFTDSERSRFDQLSKRAQARDAYAVEQLKDMKQALAQLTKLPGVEGFRSQLEKLIQAGEDTLKQHSADIEKQQLPNADAELDRQAQEIAQNLLPTVEHPTENFVPFGELTDAQAVKFYQAASASLEKLGFTHLADLEPSTTTRRLGKRVLMRLMLKVSDCAIACVWRLNASCEVIEIESHASDGHVWITNNTAGLNPFVPPPAITLLQLPNSAPAKTIWAAHQSQLQSLAPATALLAMRTVDDVTALFEHQNKIKRAHAKAKGWVSDSELKALLGVSYPMLADRVRLALDVLVKA